MRTQPALDAVAAAARERFGDNLKAIILFGSAGGADFTRGVSDVDLLFVFQHLDRSIIAQLEQFEIDTSVQQEVRFDIKPLTQREVEAAFRGMATPMFCDQWNIWMLRTGRHSFLYRSPNLNLGDYHSEEHIRRDALNKASYSILKLRKIMFLERSMILDGEVRVLSDRDLAKVCVSSCKHILTHALAALGVACDTVEDLITHGAAYFGDMSPFVRAYDLRRNGSFDLAILQDSYELAEHVYDETLARVTASGEQMRGE